MRNILLTMLVVSLSFAAVAQSSSAPALVTGTDLAKILPSTYFFRGLSATTQARNSSAVKYSDGFFVLVGLVETSGYSSDIKAKYIGFFIAEKQISIGGKTLLPGQYGMGFNPEGKFHIMDVAGNELVAADSPKDTKLARPVPLKLVVENGETRLYLGRNYVIFTAQ